MSLNNDIVLKYMKGEIRVLTDINSVKQALLKEGFHDVGVFQKWKEGQIFGLAKPINEKFRSSRKRV